MREAAHDERFEQARELNLRLLGEQDCAAPEAAKPVILLGPDQARALDETEIALLAQGIAYQRAGLLVHVVESPTGPTIRTLPEEHLLELAGRAAVYQRKDKEGRFYAVAPPMWIAGMLAARGQWRFPILDGVTDLPVLHADGSLYLDDGYDPESRQLVRIPAEVARLARAIPERPDREHAAGALAFLQEPFAEFPMTEPAAGSVVAAGILSVVGRNLIRGPIPGIAIDAAAAGSGKTLLANGISIIATGAEAPRMVPEVGAEEERKRLLALALEGAAIALFDNCTREVRSPVLAAALTASTIKDRVLKVSATATAPFTALVLVNGNGLQVRGDLSRRFLSIRLDARVEEPDARTGWRHPDLSDYLRATRPALLAAALTILRAFLRREGEAPELSAFGSFEAWSDLIRAAVCWAGGPDPCATRAELRAQADPERELLSQLFTAWHDRYGDEGATVNEALGEPALADALPDGPNGQKATARSLGGFLKRHRGRVIQGLRLEIIGKDRKGFAQWAVNAE